MIQLEEIATRLKRAQSAAIFLHMRPDGDTVGSGMALCRALSMRKVRTEVLCESDIPDKFSFLPGTKEIKKRPTFDAEVYICVDVSGTARLGALEQVFLAGAKKKTTVNIDHHVSNTRYAKYNFVLDRASNCENIAELIRLLGVPVRGEIADFLLLGMVTDSGCFSHSDVDGATFRAAAECLDGGANLSAIAFETMRRRSRAGAELYAEVISHLRYLSDGKIVCALVTREMLACRGLDDSVTEGMVDFGLGIDGVEVSVCLLEVKKTQYRISFRSAGRIDVNAVARTFGGGGHILAAGCMLFGELEEIYEKIAYAVWQNEG